MILYIESWYHTGQSRGGGHSPQILVGMEVKNGGLWSELECENAGLRNELVRESGGSPEITL